MPEVKGFSLYHYCFYTMFWTTEVTSASFSPPFSPPLSSNRKFYYITLLRDPVSRYLSEWRHVQRGATWKTSLHMCDGRTPTPEELPSCYEGSDWSGCTLQQFMECPYNLANNRQVQRETVKQSLISIILRILGTIKSLERFCPQCGFPPLIFLHNIQERL